MHQQAKLDLVLAVIYSCLTNFFLSHFVLAVIIHLFNQQRANWLHLSPLRHSLLSPPFPHSSSPCPREINLLGSSNIHQLRKGWQKDICTQILAECLPCQPWICGCSCVSLLGAAEGIAVVVAGGGRDEKQPHPSN